MRDLRPVHAVGPLKRATAEVLLDTAARASTTDFGACDPRYPTARYVAGFERAYERGLIDLAELERSMQLLKTLLDLRIAFVPGEHGVEVPNFRYEELAAPMGGCSGDPPEAGISFALARESVVDDLCHRELAGKGELSGSFAEDLSGWMRVFYARDPTEDELVSLAAVLDGCGEECSGRARSIATCIALLGSAEALFY